MNDAPAPGRRPSAMRELQALLGDRRLWAVFAGVALLFAIAGPFGTAQALGPAARAGYWLAVQGACWLCALALVAAARAHAPSRWPAALRLGLAALAASAPMAAAVGAINALVLDAPFTLAHWAGDLPRFAGLSAAVAALAHLGAAPRAAPAPPAAAQAPSSPDAAPPPLLDRLPPEKRGALLRLSMQDHYVEVVTDRGSELVLLRLTDAMREAAPVEGRRVHRSHWVARQALRGARRRNGRPVLVLSDGFEAPVSRSRAPELREAGWL